MIEPSARTTPDAIDASLALDALGDLVAVVGPDGSVRWLNAPLRRLEEGGSFRRGAAATEGAARLFAAGPESEALLRAFNEVLAGRSQRWDGDCPYRIDPQRWATVTLVPLEVSGGRGVLVKIGELSARTDAELKVRESEARWRRLVDGSPDIVFITDESSRMIYANRALEDQTGYTAADFQMRQSDNPFLHPDDAERVGQFIAAFLASSATYSGRVENRFITKAGEILWVSSVLGKTEYLGRPALQFVVQNITAERLAREESALRLKEAQEAVRSRDAFLAIAAHEPKTPLTSLRGYAQWLVRSRHADDAQRARAVDAIDRQVTRLGTLIERLLDVARIEAGRLRIHREPADLAALLREAVALIPRPTSTRLLVEAPPHLPARVDPLRIEQVVTNLVDNALRYGPDGAVRVSLRAEDGAAVIEVSDEGPGVPAERAEQIFERFFQVAGDSRQGLGLGLHVCRQIVSQHGGVIVLVPTAAPGCRFRVSLPLTGDDDEGAS
jgi:PAS domain S-box-containing protein